MPQLDKVSYFSQFFWLCFFYLGFYLVLVKYFLPKISTALKVRQKKVSVSDQKGESIYSAEVENVRTGTQDLLLGAMKHSRQSLQDTFQTTSEWLTSVTKTTNKDQLQGMNNTYANGMKDLHLSLLNAMNDLQSILPPTSHGNSGLQYNTGAKKQKFFTARVFSSLLALHSAKKKAKKDKSADALKSLQVLVKRKKISKKAK